MPIESLSGQPENPVALYKRRRDEERGVTGESERSISEIQAVKYETALLRLIRRTGGDAEIVNGLNAFIDGLERKSWFGQSDALLSNEYRQQLGQFLVQTAENLQFGMQWGGRASEEELNKQKVKWREEYHLPPEPIEKR